MFLFSNLLQQLDIKRFCCRTIFLSNYSKFEESIRMGFPEDYGGMS